VNLYEFTDVSEVCTASIIRGMNNLPYDGDGEEAVRASEMSVK
jgi:hypothetical protein